MAVLEAQGGNLWVTAKQTGISYQLLSQWNKAAVGESLGKREMQPIATQQVLNDAKRDYQEHLVKARWAYMDRMLDPEAIATTSGYYAAMTTKILTDQHQLLSGGATSRTELSLASFLGTLTSDSPQAIDSTNVVSVEAVGRGRGETNP